MQNGEKNSVFKMNNVVTLSTYLENNRPVVTEILDIYIAILECIAIGQSKEVVFHMDYIIYDYVIHKVYMTTKGSHQCAYTPEWLFACMKAALRYADENTIRLADNVVKLYSERGCSDCIKVLMQYKNKINKSHQLISIESIIFVIIIFIIVAVYYKVYGICFYG